MDVIRFDRTPYKVSYYKDGKKITIRRVPPEKLHDTFPTDKVRLTAPHSEDFPEGKTYTVKHISSRQPNVLQLENSDGQTTFVPYFDTEIRERVYPRDGYRDPRDNPKNNRYLLWP